jgi:hypothetical protein
LGCLAEELPVPAPEHPLGEAHEREEGNRLAEGVNSFAECSQWSIGRKEMEWFYFLAKCVRLKMRKGTRWTGR